MTSFMSIPPLLQVYFTIKEAWWQEENGAAVEGERIRESICIFAESENKCSAPSSRRRQLSPGQLHLDCSTPCSAPNKKGYLTVPLFIWSRIRESNPPSRLGKPLYYRYTNPASVGIIAKGQWKSKGLLSQSIQCYTGNPPHHFLLVIMLPLL